MHDEIFRTIDFHFGAGIFSIENFVAGFDVHRDEFAIFTDFAFAYGNNFTFLRLFLRGFRDDNAGPDFFLLFDRLNQDAVT